VLQGLDMWRGLLLSPGLRDVPIAGKLKIRTSSNSQRPVIVPARGSSKSDHPTASLRLSSRTKNLASLPVRRVPAPRRQKPPPPLARCRNRRDDAESHSLECGTAIDHPAVATSLETARRALTNASSHQGVLPAWASGRFVRRWQGPSRRFDQSAVPRTSRSCSDGPRQQSRIHPHRGP
jgi:hypothetical protein